MILTTKPELKVLDKNKLHVSRRPGCAAWLLLGLSAVIFMEIFSHLTSNIYFLIILLLGEIMFGLDNFGEWEDLIFYKQENKAVIIKCFWSDKLCSGASNDCSYLMRLTDIRYVGVSTKMGLFILHKSGKIITISMIGLTRDEIQSLRKEINYFLNMSRLKFVDRFSIDNIKPLLLPSDSEEEFLQNLREIHSPISNELTVSDNVLANNKKCYSVQQNLSSPSLMRGTRFNSCQSTNLRKSPYTENSIHLDYINGTRNTCIQPVFHNLFKFDKNCK